MEQFTLDENVARWETALLSLRGAARFDLLLPLAWHLRQRDNPRARLLAAEALGWLPLACPELAARQRAATRLSLIEVETRWLDGDLDSASLLVTTVLDQFTQLGDHAGCADAYWLRAWIEVDRGEHERCNAALEVAAQAAREAGDPLRVALAQACSARWSVLRDLHHGVARWGGTFHADMPDMHEMHPALATWVNDFLALSASLVSDFGLAAGRYIACYEAALKTGQVRAAITAANNIGEDFRLLNDLQSALEWMQCALDLARPTGWPRSIGTCLMHTADTLRRLGRLDAAAELLDEALAILAPMAQARSYAVALQYQGDLALDRGDAAAALASFERMSERAEALDQADFRSIAWRGRADALSRLDRPGEALAAARQAVATAAEQNGNHMAALRVLAAIHARHRLPAPAGAEAPNGALHYLHQALALASQIAGYTVPGDLYDAIAHEYAAAGEHALAYEMALAASAAREKTHTQEATSRAIAMQVHHQTEHARAEGYHHRELAASEARRAEVLQQTSATLERLSAIGQEITTHLDAAAVFQALDRHVHSLLIADTFAIYLTDASGQLLNRAFGMEQGRPLPTNTIALSHPKAYAARCLAEQREIYVAHSLEADHFTVIPGTLSTMSALFAPLTIGERALGVMTVQALTPHAYNERERLIFRTLCAYGAIALDNAEAYRQLQDAQTQLVSQEKLAALGALMAGVAHELNTPIGNSLLIASTLQQKTSDIAALMNGPGLRRSELVAYIGDAEKASTLVMRGLTSAADLVNSFKQVAVDRTTEQRRLFNLQQVSHEIIATMMNRIRAAGHAIDFEIPAAIVLDSYPGPFGQVVANFINNALLHAFDDGAPGRMWLSATALSDERVQIQFRDNGSGIADAHLGRIFDPFFTTKLGQGGSGLGLSISYNIVTSLLGGHIGVHSAAGVGTTFTLDLPLTAPEQDPARAASIY